MCRLFVGADPGLWEAQTRSMRLDGMCTSVRLESFFWGVLEEIGRRDGLTLGQLLTRLARESSEAGHDLDNFASFLRVCCARYQALQLSGEIPADAATPIAALDAAAILAREGRRHAHPLTA
ncbi:ribbon-helix-helix domain-containing protein [Halomonas sp. ML-15]|uniref:ribbon-helix-helix domain-containing protein n=1 Tax=Halomonas sp. ML-15 TaxID=2773305 RepID=UPI0017461B2C|nr:ribbon-helix-helix domain-containing protein [Halomonas sp. ML-15]MBD3894370.1 ribbon-helix-helix domain-containing protein [Halomonas sp. ML-15]